MTIYKYIRVISWFILTVFCCSASCAMITTSILILDIFSVLFMTFWVYVSYKSKCFLTIRYKSDNR